MEVKKNDENCLKMCNLKEFWFDYYWWWRVWFVLMVIKWKEMKIGVWLKYNNVLMWLFINMVLIEPSIDGEKDWK